jgi:hypothetical protein
LFNQSSASEWRGATKAVYHAGADEKGVAEDEGLPAARELDRIFAEGVGEEMAGMPADNRVFEGGVLRRVGGGRPGARCRASRPLPPAYRRTPSALSHPENSPSFQRV